MIHSKGSITGEVISAVINDDNKEEKRRIQIPPLEIRLSVSLKRFLPNGKRALLASYYSRRVRRLNEGTNW
jgi:hypothetical protein